jgi:hypothetical protein
MSSAVKLSPYTWRTMRPSASTKLTWLRWSKPAVVGTKLKPKFCVNSSTMAAAGLRNSQLGRLMPCWVAKAFIASGESKGWLKPMLTMLKRFGAEHADRVFHGLLQVFGGGRADLEAGGVDEIHQQRLALVVGQSAWAGPGGRAGHGRPAACRWRSCESL